MACRVGKKSELKSINETKRVCSGKLSYACTIEEKPARQESRESDGRMRCVHIDDVAVLKRDLIRYIDASQL